jgi:AcrR family transcriptional regulator
MKSVAVLTPAPKRGRYDRALSRNERQAVQRERVTAAVTSIAAAGGELSVASVVERAGIGRNTFYEYFDDIEHALATLRARVLHELDARIQRAFIAARTPLERVRALARAWTENAAGNPELTVLALRARLPERDTPLSPLGGHLVNVLERELESRSALPGLADRLRLLAVAAAFEAVTFSHLARPLEKTHLDQVLAELALRLLR